MMAFTLTKKKTPIAIKRGPSFGCEVILVLRLKDYSLSFHFLKGMKSKTDTLTRSCKRAKLLYKEMCYA